MVDGGEEGDDVGEGVDGLIADGGLGEVEKEAEERVEECHVVCAEEGGEEGELLGREEVELVILTAPSASPSRNGGSPSCTP